MTGEKGREALRCLDCRPVSIVDSSADKRDYRRAAARGVRLYCPRCDDHTIRQWFIQEPHLQEALL